MSTALHSQPVPPSAAIELFGWWRAELRFWLGSLSRRSFADQQRSAPDIIVLRDGVLIGPERRGPFGVDDIATGASDLSGWKGRPRAVAVMLAQGRFIKRKLADHRIPLERAQKMAELDVESQTPFKLEQIYILFADPMPGETGTHAYLVRHDILDPVLDALSRGRHRLGALTFEEEGQPRDASRFVVLGLNHRGDSVLARVAKHAFGIICVVLIVLAAFNISAALATALSTVDRTIDAVEPKAKAARAAFKERAARLERIEAVRTEQHAYVPVARLMEELTTILPDTTYLTSVSVRPGKVKITGISTDAAALIPLVDGSGLFANPRFVSAVVKVPDRNGEQFDLEAEVENDH